MLALKVRKEKAELLRKLLADKGLLDKSKRIFKRGKSIIIPLTQEIGSDLLKEFGAELIDENFSDARKILTPFEIICERAKIPEPEKALLPRRWELVGDVLILKIPDKLEKYEHEIAEIYADVLRAKAVVKDLGIAGELRVPKAKLILGEGTETTHKENGIKYRLDVSKVMFSSGNIDERIRMGRLSCDGDVVVDMFAGIGYFTLPVAVHSKPKMVFAYEKNPTAFKYLKENILLNKVDGVVKPILDDNLNAMEGIADRVIMGYIGNTRRFLPKGFRILKGKGTIHYHETCPNELLPDAPFKNVNEVAGKLGRRVKLLNFRVIKSYAPGVSHLVLDVGVE